MKFVNLPLFFSILFLSSFIFSYFCSQVCLNLLKKWQIWDNPCNRSNHTIPTPVGGGLAIIMTMAVFFPLSALFEETITLFTPFYWVQLWCGGLLLAFISFKDDIKPIAIHWRLMIQIIAVLMGLDIVADEGFIFQGLLPWGWDRAASAFIWLWFINLYNFMDGMDGLTASHSYFLSLGLVIICILFHNSLDVAYYACILMGSSLGFLKWNWPPAKMFMGDVGSITLGYIFGWLLLTMAIRGWWLPMCILPSYYLCDSSITLAKRLFQGKKIWEAHSEHFFQKAIHKRKEHIRVLYPILGAEFLLMCASITSTFSWLYKVFSLFAAVSINIILLHFLKKK